ncbi:MAG: ABC transporter permease subunit, partial [Singulisphaera sp.]
EIRSGSADAVVAIPPDVRGQLKGNRSVSIPIDYFSTDERSQITYLRVREVLARWKDKIVSGRLARDQKPASYTEPIESRAIDVASLDERGGSVWARLFPFLLVMMSLTGAFYPAVDICAGEKERGTMETLLISPASRGEIVMGKFLTVVLASMMTALLNLASMGLTAMQLVGQVGGMAREGHEKAGAVMAAPSLASAAWMVLLLIPLSVFFSAVCLALAVLARSMKEGQYYMTPLYMICLPLIFLTLAPGVELNLFYSLVPITGVSLLLRALILGDYAVAGRYFLPVLVPTMIYGAVALRWAVEQFQSEDVLFREAERLDLRSWLRHLVRDREPLPTGAQALLCFALMLSSAWFLTLYLSGQGLASSWKSIVAGQASLLIIPVAMTLLLTRTPADPPAVLARPRYLILAVGLVLRSTRWSTSSGRSSSALSRCRRRSRRRSR